MNFLVGGRIVDRWPTYHQNTLKIGKDTGFGTFFPRIWRGRPLLNFSLEGTRPLRPPRFRCPWPFLRYNGSEHSEASTALKSPERLRSPGTGHTPGPGYCRLSGDAGRSPISAVTGWWTSTARWRSRPVTGGGGGGEALAIRLQYQPQSRWLAVRARVSLSAALRTVMVLNRLAADQTPFDTVRRPSHCAPWRSQWVGTNCIRIWRFPDLTRLTRARPKHACLAWFASWRHRSWAAVPSPTSIRLRGSGLGLDDLVSMPRSRRVPPARLGRSSRVWRPACWSRVHLDVRPHDEGVRAATQHSIRRRVIHTNPGCRLRGGAAGGSSIGQFWLSS